MVDDSYERVREVFDAAYELSADERAAYLDRACGGDAELRARVERLLAAADEEHPFLSEPTGARGAQGALGSTERATSAEGPGSRIGRYKLLEQIGEGGFGTVYMAEQEEPVRRRVALKIIKPGMDTRQVIARFEAERQALAMMDHPGIARVLDAGETDLGHPYFVMELVRGEPITEYCDRHELSTGERLGLFMRVCHAVQHAHQKGVIHRDLKPSNVLITVADGKGVPKIIDFGIAKATGGKLTELTLFTEHRALIGTPAYMSPEQADFAAMDIDTRSDIYSLGVLLYELLTGTTPFDTKELMAAGLAEIQRIIREVEPEKPSTRLSSLSQTPPGDRTRASDPARLSSIVRGDLDWIVLRAMEKDRSRRYETASGLAADVERHLAGEPVEAAPPSAAYRVRKFARRHRVGVAASSLVVLSLAAGVIGTTIGLVRAEHRRREAVEAQRLAERREQQTRRVSEFQAGMLSEIFVEAMGRGIKERFREQVRAALERQYVGEAPNRRERTSEEVEAALAVFDELAGPAQGADVARGIIDEFVLGRAAGELETRFVDQPLVRAQLRFAIGTAYQELGLYEAAEPHLEEALALRRLSLGDEHADTLASMDAMGVLLHHLGKPAGAEAYLRESLEGRSLVLGEDDPETLSSIHNLANLLREEGRYSEAEPLFLDALEDSRRVLGDTDVRTLRLIGDIGRLLERQGRHAEAEPYQREAVAGFRRVLGDEHPDTLGAIHLLGLLLTSQGRYDAAEPLCQEALEGRRRVLGVDHPVTISSLAALGDLLHYQRRYDEAERYLQECLRQSRRVLGDSHPDTLQNMNDLGFVWTQQGRLAEAESILAEGVKAARIELGDHPTTAVLEHHHADVLLKLDRVDEAIEPARYSVDRYRSHPDWTPTEASHARQVLIAILRAAGRQAETLAVMWDWIEAARRDDTPASVLASGLATYATVAIAVGDQSLLDRAERAAREALDIRQRVLAGNHPRRWLRYDAMSVLGSVLAARGAGPGLDAAERVSSFIEAESLLIEAHEWFAMHADLIPERYRAVCLRRAIERTVDLYESWDAGAPGEGKAELAEEWRARLEALP